MATRFDFDEVAKDLACGLSRREALGRLAGGLAGAVLASVGLESAWGQGGGASFPKCSTYCNTLPRPQRANCNRACKECGGNTQNLCPSPNSPAVACCPTSTSCCAGVCCTAAQTCCSSACTDTSTDPHNCGGCGGFCDEVHRCCSGSCRGIFVDPNNCGACGNKCPRHCEGTVAVRERCIEGVCGGEERIDCPSIGGTCIQGDCF